MSRSTRTLVIIVAGLAFVFVVIELILAAQMSKTVQPVQSAVSASTTQQIISTPINENLKPNDFTGCINNGGKDITPDFNALQKCILDNRIYESDCVSNDKYFVVENALIDSVGSDILVKYKSTNDQKYSCEYLASDSDFQIKNKWAEYVLALENNFLILDSGTGPPPRGLIVYDLISRKKVFTDSYSNPIAINSDTVTYWSPVSTKPYETNCPKLSEYTAEGLGAVIEARVVLTLSTLNKTEVGEYRCSATQ